MAARVQTPNKLIRTWVKPLEKGLRFNADESWKRGKAKVEALARDDMYRYRGVLAV